VELSDGVSSGVEGPHLVVDGWVEVSHSQDELVGSDVRGDLNGSS